MMKTLQVRLLLNPFTRIAGYQALGWGVAGIALSTLLSILSGWHYHGLLHFGPAPNSAWWCFMVEHLTVWLVPSLLLYVGSLLLSRSRIRAVDVFGTVAFAQLPFLFMDAFNFLPPMQYLLTFNADIAPTAMLSQPNFLLAVWLSLFTFIFIVWVLYWMFKALKVSTNLKGYRLGILYAIAIVGGDVICRQIISQFY